MNLPPNLEIFIFDPMKIIFAQSNYYEEVKKLFGDLCKIVELFPDNFIKFLSLIFLDFTFMFESN